MSTRPSHLAERADADIQRLANAPHGPLARTVKVMGEVFVDARLGQRRRYRGF